MANEPCKASSVVDTPPRKVAVIGKAPSSRDLAPYDDADFDIWTLSNLVSAGEVPRFTRHFEMHPLEWIEDRRDEYMGWMAGLNGDASKLWLRAADDRLPGTSVYPVKQIVAQFGTYFTNTVSWMIALAIQEKRPAIHVYGVDMAQETEYAEQRPSCEFFLGWAAGAGIEIHVPAEADMLKTRKLYGVDHDGDFYTKWKTRGEELKKRHRQKMAEMEMAMKEAAFLEGAIDSQNYFKQWI